MLGFGLVDWREKDAADLVASLLDRVQERIRAKIAAHQQTLMRIEAFRANSPPRPAGSDMP